MSAAWWKSNLLVLSMTWEDDEVQYEVYCTRGLFLLVYCSIALLLKSICKMQCKEGSCILIWKKQKSQNCLSFIYFLKLTKI